MKLLPKTAPEVYEAFLCGDCVTKETENSFNQIPDDQALKHVNHSGKVAGGLVGITRTDSARDRWRLTYNERAKLSEDTKTKFNVGGKEGDSHRELGKARLRRDEKDVLKLVSCFTKYEVFCQAENLVSVTTGDVASEEVRHDLQGAEEIGKTIVKQFVQDRLIKKDVKFHDGVKQNRKLKTFETLYCVPVSLDNNKTVTLKADRDLLRRVVVALESGRNVDVDELLQRELSPVPFSIATPKGSLREASGKSDLSKILQQNVSQSQRPVNQSETCTIIDGMAAVQSLANASGAKTFGEWCDKFSAFVSSHFSENCTRVDVVFDRYLPNSIKGGTRRKRRGKSKGMRRVRNWGRFIALENNKASLAHFLCTKMSESHIAYPRRELVVSGGFSDILKVWSSDRSREDFEGLASNHEEADTRIILHARDATVGGYSQVNVLCCDTDVLVLLLAHRENLCPNIWMFFVTSRRTCYISVHKITLPEEKRKSLLAFHALTECDTTSRFVGIGKQKAWKAFDGPSVKLLEHLGEESHPNANVLADAEAFVCQLYNKGTEVHVNKERATAFRKTRENLDSLPPTQDALQLHLRRVNHQVLIWKTALQPCPPLPNPDGNGWFYDEEGVLKVKLMTQEVISAACLELTFCGCTRGGNCCANRRCTCVRLALQCSKACKCEDFCRNTVSASQTEKFDES